MTTEIRQHRIFLNLINAGLWGKEVCLSQYRDIDYSYVMRLAEEQSVVGLVTSGLECVKDVKIQQEIILQFIGQTLQIEQRNTVMNAFVAELTENLRKADVHALLVKGQGIAQCYEKPLWRACGDVDFLLDEENYERGKIYLSGIAQEVHEENDFDKHFSAIIDGWDVELHGSMRSMLRKGTDDLIDRIQDEAISLKRHRVWNNNETNILLPCVDDDVIFVFTHILKHFFHYGIGLRQVCDWCRLLYVYHDDMDMGLLERRLKDMRLMSEWQVFGSLAVNRLGMPKDLMPFYEESRSLKRKADNVLSFIFETGNFGHNRDNSRNNSSNAVMQKIGSLWQHTLDSMKQTLIFPVDSIRIWGRMFYLGLKDALRGK